VGERCDRLRPSPSSSSPPCPLGGGTTVASSAGVTTGGATTGGGETIGAPSTGAGSTGEAGTTQAGPDGSTGAPTTGASSTGVVTTGVAGNCELAPECEAGAVETGALCDSCGVLRRSCQADCSWTPMVCEQDLETCAYWRLPTGDRAWKRIAVDPGAAFAPSRLARRPVDLQMRERRLNSSRSLTRACSWSWRMRSRESE